jgi:hypothetical protein
MTRTRTRGQRLMVVLFVSLLGFAPASIAFTPDVAYAQADLSVDPKAASPAVSDLRRGFQFVPEKSEQREPVPGIVVYEADFVRDQTKENFASGPIEIKSLVAKTANASQAAEQFSSSRQALTSASPAWVESKVSKLGDEATGLTMEGTSSEGPAVAHLYLFRRGAMVVGITVAGLTKPTRMAEAEAIAAVVLRKIDPSVRSATGPRQPRPLNARGATPSNSGSGASTTQMSATTGAKVRVANTGGTGLRLRAQPSLTAAITARLADGTTLDVVGEDKQANGITWKNVKGGAGNNTGWVSAQYVVPATGGGGATTTSTTQTSARTTTTGAPATGTSTTPPPSTSTTGESLQVVVNVKNAQLKKGQEQVVDILVTKNGQPVSGAQVTAKTSPTAETPEARPTDSSGKTSVKWTPSMPPASAAPLVGVGVSAVTADGSAGVGGASFEITN